MGYYPSPVPSVVLADSWYRYPGESRRWGRAWAHTTCFPGESLPPVPDPVCLQFVKCGMAGDNLPRYTFPSMVGRPMLRAEEGAIGDGDNLSVGATPRETLAFGECCFVAHPREVVAGYTPRIQ